LKCKHHDRRRTGRLSVRCEAAVAEKEEASGEKFEYQAEVGFCVCQLIYLFALLGRGFWIFNVLKTSIFCQLIWDERVNL